MKLIVETLEAPISVIREAREDGKKNLFIEGVFLVGEKANKNNRIYRESVLAKEVARYTKDLIEANRAYGELGHPAGPAINLDRVSHHIVSLVKEGSNFIGKAKIASTPMGDIVKGLLEDGASLGVSSRGMGTLKERNGIMEVQDDFMLATAADIVADPSAPGAFVRGIMENVEWLYDIKSGTWHAAEILEDVKKNLKSMSLSQINEKKLQIFEGFLNNLANKTIL